MSPYKIIFGAEPRLPIDNALANLNDCKINSVTDFIKSRAETFAFVKAQLAKAASAMKRSADRRRREPTITPGDLVWLSTANLRLRPN